GMGVSKPPQVHLSQQEFRFTCKYKDTLKGQVVLQTPVKKWVYAEIKSDQPWLKVLQPQVAGPQKATVPFEIDTNLWNLGPAGAVKFVPALVMTVLLCLALRIFLVPFVDGIGWSSAASSAATKLKFDPAADSDFSGFGGWLKLPWLPILARSDGKISAEVFQK